MSPNTPCVCLCVLKEKHLGSKFGTPERVVILQPEDKGGKIPGGGGSVGVVNCNIVQNSRREACRGFPVRRPAARASAVTPLRRSTAKASPSRVGWENGQSLSPSPWSALPAIYISLTCTRVCDYMYQCKKYIIYVYAHICAIIYLSNIYIYIYICIFYIIYQLFVCMCMHTRPGIEICSYRPKYNSIFYVLHFVVIFLILPVLCVSSL